ncbi:hypothetical protein [uncultured Polaribacter sp.]|uniref:hypothetical protein n=1 Tax=uncultured Polaribacter sp. TaxID=174711 RepID=UPI00262086AB|nr:hypothetical protein [uncultured Polaribacter sp.]
MGKKLVAMLGLLLCLLGVLIQIFENKDSNLIPEILNGTGLWFLIIGSSFSLFYSLTAKQKKDK